MWEKSVEAAFIQTCQWLDLCARNGITLNPQKFQFAQDTVDFSGLTITPTNICPSAKFLDAIRDFPVPTDITGARAWFGLINQGAYAFAMTKQMKPFRALLKPSTKFTWNDDLTHTFEKSKEIIIQEMRDGVRLFDPDRLTCLSTDWSVEGIGFFLMQKYCDCLLRTPACCPDGWKLCLVGSRFTHPAESRYAPIEGEALAVAYALHQTRYYVLGCKDLLVATDHKPLLQILNNRSLTEIDNRRLLNLGGMSNIDLCARNGITLNPQKFQFAQDTVDFAGLTITPTNICPSAKFLDAIRDFPVPTDITGARAWFGLINQGAYAFAMTKQMKPFRALLKPSTKFTWNDDLTHTFEKSKEIIIQEMRDGVRLFDPDRLTCLSTDWSVEGIGFFLMQKYCDCLLRTPACCPDGWKLCLVGSRFTHPAESRYAPIEGEALAVAYALHQTRYYVLGCKDLLVATDHKPLLQILNNRSLTEIDNRRLLNLKEKTLGYRFSIIHVAGKKNLGPDAVSRYPAGSPDRLTLPGEPSEIDSLDVTAVSCRETLASLCLHSEDEDIANDTAMVMEASQTLYAVSNVVTWDMVRESTASDPTLVEFMNHIISGFPTDCRELAVEHRPYYRYAASLCVVDGVVLLGQRIVIPPALRGPILDALHSAHQGVSVMRARANDTVYWPDINVDIARVRDQCMSCHQMAKSNPMQPPSDIKTPEYPFQMICADYFTFNNTDYVVVVDRYSNWPMVFKSESGADGLIRRLRETFVTFGIPEELTSDGGPQFTAGKTQEFLRSWGVNHRLTSVANPHANCRAELAVKTVKRMLMDNTTSTGSLDIDKFQRAMLTYRNSIDPETKASPALILFGRPIRDAIPILMGRYSPHETWKELMSHRELALAKRHSREHEKWSEHTRKLPPLRVGDHVFLQNLTGNHPRRWDRTGTVVEVKQFHQYVVRVDGTGRVTLRNRQHLRKFIPYNKRVDPLQGLDHDPSASTRVDPATVTRNPVDHQSNNTKVAMPPTSPTRGPPIDLPVTRQDSQTQIATPPTSPIRGPPPSLPVSNNNLDSPVDMPPPAESDPPNSPVEIRTPTIRLPRALQRLQPYNKPGTKELSPPARAMRRPNIEH